MTVGEIKRILNKKFNYDSDNDTYYLMEYHPWRHGHNTEFSDDDGLIGFQEGI